MVLSHNTGHADLIDEATAEPAGHTDTYGGAAAGGAGLLSHPRLYPVPCARTASGASTGWGEADVGKAVEALLHVYDSREQARAKGRAAAKFIRRHFTWEQSIARVSGLLQAELPAAMQRAKQARQELKQHSIEL